MNKIYVNLHEENHTTLMNEIKGELNKWRDIPCSKTRRLDSIKMSVLPKLIYRFSAISVKISVSYLMDIDQLTLKFIWRGKRNRMPNTILKEKNKVGGLILPNFRTYY
uniref:Uncharacterized protein n=1 Tax=Sus scrofa TaxID=9823 RepID=A0A8D0MGM4_PIG